MSFGISNAVILSLLLTASIQAQQADHDRPTPSEEVAPPAVETRRPLEFAKRDWSLTQAYFDVFKILNDQNTCSNFYRGPRAATTVLNDFATAVRTRPLRREVSFQMTGVQRRFHDPASGVSYRLFDRIMVNSNGSFYQRRADANNNFPANVGNFSPGSRSARALILLHELGHLIEGEDGIWLIPDDGRDGSLSKANTLRVQKVCRRELEALQ